MYCKEDNDDKGELMHEKALNIFTYNNDKAAYVFTVSNLSQFYLICSMVGGGASFRMVTNFLQAAKKFTAS